MSLTLAPDLKWLTYTVLMTALFWVPYIINRMLENGPLKAVWNPQPDPGPRAAWANRMMKAHENAVENLVIFAPLVLLIHMLGIQSATTTMACVVYFYARLTHYLVFTFAVPVLRVVTFLIGFAAQMVLAVTIIKTF